MRTFLNRVTLSAIAVISLFFITVPASAQATQAWTSPVTLTQSGNNGSSTPVQFASTPAGALVAAWMSGAGGGVFTIQVSLSHDQGLTWSTPVTVSDPAGHAEGAHVAVNGSGTIMVAWDADVSSSWQTTFSRSTDGGITWTAPLAISDTNFSTEGFALTGTLDDSFVVAMQQHNGAFFDVVGRESSDNGQNWSAPTMLSDGVSNAIGVQLAADPAGNVAVSWLQYVSSTYHPVMRDSSNAGQSWNSRVELPTTGQDASLYPYLMSAESGRFTQIWRATDGANYEIMSSDEIMGSSWRTPFAIDLGSVDYPYFVVGHNADGFIAVAWSYDDGTNLQINLLRSFDNGVNWDSLPTVIATLPNTPGAQFWAPALAVDNTGAIALAWTRSEGLSPEQNQVRVMNSTDFGDTWSAITDVAPAGSLAASLTSLGSGTFVLSWTKSSDGSGSNIQTSSYGAAHLPDTGANAGSNYTSVIFGVSLLLVGITVTSVSRRRELRR